MAVEFISGANRVPAALCSWDGEDGTLVERHDDVAVEFRFRCCRKPWDMNSTSLFRHNLSSTLLR